MKRLKYQVFKSQPLTGVMKALPRKYTIQMKPTNEIVSAVYYINERSTVTSVQALKGIEKLGKSDNKKIAIARNFTDEAITLLKENGFYLIFHSQIPVADEQIMKKAHESN